MIGVGHSPIHYFILGLCEIGVCALLFLVVHNPSKASYLLSYLVDTDAILFLPVYFVVVNLLLFIGVCISIEHLVGYYVEDLPFIIGHWIILRLFAESASAFFAHAGFGRRSARESIAVGLLSTTVFAAVLLACYYVEEFSDYEAVIGCGIAILGTILVYYTLSWLLPQKYYHRRPASKHFSFLNMILLTLQVLSLIAAAASPDGGHDRDTAVKFLFTVTQMLQIIIILIAFSEDSLYWQGFYTDDNSNLNHPVLGVWDLNTSVLHTAVSRTITHLERKVVRIIPYSQLAVDTSKFFAGGSARVYKGSYDQQEVAIKFLFCIELTPERVADFCHEATLLNSLQHPNVVRCFGVAIMPPAISLVTEYCTYGSLFDFLHTTDLVVNDPASADGSGGRDSLSNRLRTSTSDSTGRERTSTASGRYRANSRNVSLLESLTRDSFGGGGSNSGRLRASSRAVDAANNNNRDSLSSNNLEFIRRDSEPVSGLRGSDVELGMAGSPLHSQPPASGAQPAAAAQRSSRGANRMSFTWRGTPSGPNTPMQNPVGGSSAVVDSAAQSELLARYLTDGDRKEGESVDIAARLADAMTNKRNSVGLSQKHSVEHSSLRWGSNSFNVRIPRMPSLHGEMVSPPPPETARLAVPPTPMARLRSATSVLMSSDMGFGLGPNATRITSTPAQPTTAPAQRTLSVSRPGSPSVTPKSRVKSSRSRLSNPSMLASLLMTPSSANAVGRLLPPHVKLKMARDCCAGLAFLHSKNLMHCDIKSLNFLVCSDLTVKLADLGETRHLSEDADSHRDIPVNMNWSSPEVLSGQRSQVNQAADVWSLAMVVAEIMTGEVPFDTQHYRSMEPEQFLLRLKDHERPSLPKTFLQMLWLEDMLYDAWHFDPALRCTAAAMSSAFIENGVE